MAWMTARGAVPCDVGDVDEPLAAPTVVARREPVERQRGEDPAGDRERVDELAGRPARVDVDAVHGEHDLARRERLVLQLPGLRAVERVGAARAEALDVEPERALADLLVGREAHAQRRPRELGVRRQMSDGRDDLGHPGLVVGAEQRVAARRHDVVPDLPGQHRHVRRVEHRPAARQRDRPAVVAAVHERLDAVPGASGDVSTCASSPITGSAGAGTAASRTRSPARRATRPRVRPRAGRPPAAGASSS